MSSDEYFDELDSAFLQQVDAIEAAHVQPRASSSAQPPPPRPPHHARSHSAQTVIEIDDDSEDFGSFSIDAKDLEIIDQIVDNATQNTGRFAPVAGPSRSFARTTSRATVQTTLFGGRAVEPASKAPSSSRQPVSRTGSNANNATTSGSRKAKKWDHTAFAKTGWKKPKGKDKQSFDGEEQEEEEAVEFEQFPAPFVSVGPPPPMKLQADRLAARRWLYPLNQSRRDYQYNIVRRCLFDNTLVALPTGLGKTFIAGVVMLNFYTWFPQGKVVFVAPTKPLVAQQIDACHKTCGIPGSHAAELTGQNPRPMRHHAWKEKRVFYMTPQTLMNDLKTDNCDPKDIVLLVIDEAHKGTGDYAYAQVVRYMMAKNPHFRILALTATPGGKPEAVQAIVDALHISHIEIRDEQSLDLQQYMHKKHIEQHIIPMSEDVARIRDMLGEVMTPMIQKLYNAKLLYGNPNPVSLHPYSCQKALGALSAGGGARAPWAFSMLSKLGALARAMGYLIEGSLNMCYSSLQELSSGVTGAGHQIGSKANTSQFQKDQKLQAVIQELEALKNQPGGFPIHPKMDKMKTLLVEHFAQQQFDREDAQANGSGEDLTGDSKVMIFASFRLCVEELVALLEKEKPLIKPVAFIGRGTDKNGNKGYGQKEQLDIIKRFKQGEFNVLVSTSIGEEGLDIGEIDMIVCYDAQKTPIRMLQRIGRTGRKRDGRVHVLLSEDREERNWDKADDNYKDVQRFIIKADQLELYDDAERLIPENITPTPVEMVMEIEQYAREDPQEKKAQARALKAPKRVRDDNAMRNIPAGASTSFVNVRQLLVGKKHKAEPIKNIEDHLSDLDKEDEDDLDIAAGINVPRRTQSMPTAVDKRKKKLKPSATMPNGPQRKKSTKKKTEPKGLPISLDQLAATDSEDEDIARGIMARPSSKPNSKSQRPSKALSTSSTSRSASKCKSMSSVIELSSSPPPSPVDTRSGRSTTSRSQSTQPSIIPTLRTQTTANGDTVDLTALAEPSSPLAFRWPTPEDLAAGPSNARVVSSSPTSRERSASLEAQPASMAWLIDDDDDEPRMQIVGSSPLSERRRNVTSRRPASDSEVEIVPGPEVTTRSSISPAKPKRKAPPRPTKGGKVQESQIAMPPPILPAKATAMDDPGSSPPRPAAQVDFSSPALTYAPRGPSKASKKRIRVDSSPGVETPAVAAAPRRLRRQLSRELEDEDGSPKPKKRKKTKFADIVAVQKHVPWVDVEAAHSGDELSQGSEADDDPMSESDRLFVVDSPQTQVAPSYDQSAVYRRSLMTQAPGGSMPAFARRPVKRGGVAYGAGPSKPQTNVMMSSSPPRDSESDDYTYGSFVVDDDAEISYINDAQPSSDL